MENIGDKLKVLSWRYGVEGAAKDAIGRDALSVARGSSTNDPFQQAASSVRSGLCDPTWDPLAMAHATYGMDNGEPYEHSFRELLMQQASSLRSHIMWHVRMRIPKNVKHQADACMRSMGAPMRVMHDVIMAKLMADEEHAPPIEVKVPQGRPVRSP